jgi:hypothetical protein
VWNSKTSILKLQSVQICNNNHLPASQLWEERLLSSHSPANFRKTKVPIYVWSRWKQEIWEHKL